jgi:HEAT repeat protein
MPALIQALRDEDANVRGYAIATLGQIGPGAKEAVPALLATLNDKDASVRAWAVGSLAVIGADSDVLVPVLMGSLNDGNKNLRASAARALGKVGSDARAAVPLLVRLVKEERFDEVRYPAAEAVILVDPAAHGEAVVPFLIAYVQRADYSQARVDALQLLGKLGSRAKAAGTVVTELLEDEEENVRAAAAETLKQIGKH